MTDKGEVGGSSPPRPTIFLKLPSALTLKEKYLKWMQQELG